MTFGEIVIHPDLVTSRCENTTSMRADVTGTTDNKNIHEVT
jgi:hypothetical protein